MTDKYEAAEVLVIGRAQDVILGIKDVSFPDNRTSTDTLHIDSPQALFEE